MKIALYIVLTIVVFCLLNFWHEVYFQGHYFRHAGLFLAILGALIPVLILYIAYLFIKKIKSL